MRVMSKAADKVSSSAPQGARGAKPSRFYDPAGYCADESIGWLMKRG